MPHPITTYLQQLTNRLSTGAATEQTHRPALAALIEAIGENVRAINEPARIACGAPDLAILEGEYIVGHVEAKDVDVSLDSTEQSEQFIRYRQALDNLILTNHLEFRWYVNGNHRQSVRLARLDENKQPQLEYNSRHTLKTMLLDFLGHQPQPISTPHELAERMARLTHLIRDIIVKAFTEELASEMLNGWRRAFARVLIPDLDQAGNLSQFADMFAQTLSYGLFSARIMHETGPFNRYSAQRGIPRTNPFLRNFFAFITGPQLEDEPYAELVDDLIQLLSNSDMDAILADFNRSNRQDDPMMHFYETFLAAYDPRLRERRGVYYTPMPVVSFIVRSVDALLKTHFDLPGGLADTTLLPDGTHKVLVLDPAVGTATFLYAVIDLIRDEFMQRNNAGMWSGYVRDHLLKRIFGFEIMMAPYAVAHFKLALQLAGHDLDLPEEARSHWAYDFQADDRIQVYLTNALEVLPEDTQGLYGPMQFVTEEAKAADAVKQDKPIMVVLGNPPYSISSANRGDHIEALMERYKASVREEQNIQPLSDDYIKFIRFAHDRIERTGSGIVAMITNHIFLNGLIHRGMREELFHSFDEIFIINLHGNSIVMEISPDGSNDENVFDIRQGVAISIFIKNQNVDGSETIEKKLFYSELWGSRNEKYSKLLNSSIENIKWTKIKTSAPYFFFVPKHFSFHDEYKEYYELSDLFLINSRGIETGRDEHLIQYNKKAIQEVIELISDSSITNTEIEKLFGIKSTSGWPATRLRKNLLEVGFNKKKIIKILYRPFDYRYTYFSNYLRRTHT